MRKPETSMPSSRAVAMCWAETSASVQWVATRTERTPRSWARLRSCDGADAGQDQRGQPGPVHVGRGDLDPLPVGVAAGAVGERCPRQPVAVGHLDRVDAGGVQRARRSRATSSRVTR